MAASVLARLPIFLIYNFSGTWSTLSFGRD
jgi:hypothetical protein